MIKKPVSKIKLAVVLASAALLVWAAVNFADIVSSPDRICYPVNATTSERSPECAALIQEEVGRVLNHNYGRWMVTPGTIDYKYWSQVKSEVYREIKHQPGILGFEISYENAPSDIVILYPRIGSSIPVEFVIAHEQVHAFQDINRLPDDELEARDVSFEVWIRLFHNR